MIGLPGTNSQIIQAFESVYGKERADEWLDHMLKCMGVKQRDGLFRFTL